MRESQSVEFRSRRDVSFGAGNSYDGCLLFALSPTDRDRPMERWADQLSKTLCYASPFGSVYIAIGLYLYIRSDIYIGMPSFEGKRIQ